MKHTFEWIVVGAGPAGIASVGKLLDAGIAPAEIAWIDPQFKVGDFGTLWRYVGSNTPVEAFLKFYHRCKVFQYANAPEFMINKIEPSKNCPLMLAAQPLTWITEQLVQAVAIVKDHVTHLKPGKIGWHLDLSNTSALQAKKVILAVGGEQKELHFAGTTTIPLQIALNPTQLKQATQPEDQIVVFGSAQSAKSVIENVKKIPAKKIILFYRSESTLNRHFHQDELLEGIHSLEMTSRNLLAEMPQCTKVIYAIGFERRHIPIAGLPRQYGYDKKTGEIAPGIFGVGMAFPEIMPYELGKVEYPVTSIWPFMKRLDKLLPKWLDTL